MICQPCVNGDHGKCNKATCNTCQHRDRINAGGLMRCCTDTISGLYTDAPSGKVGVEGQTLQCAYTGDPLHSMIFEHGTWHWHMPRDDG